MEVITMDSETFRRLQSQLDRIENLIERTTGIYDEIDSNLEMTNNEVMETFNVSASTLYRWRRDGCIEHRYLANREIRYPFKSVYSAIKYGLVKLPGLSKDESLSLLNRFKDRVIISGIATKK